jgi:hypothetical protein
MKRIAIGIIFLVLAGCQTSDKEIRADIAGKAQQDLNFSGLRYTVTNGIVNFTGRCPSKSAFTKIKQTIENIHVIKAVHYNVRIAPVMLDTLTLVKLQADSILAKYSQVSALINTNGIILKGPISSNQQKQLINELKKCRHSKIIDSLTIL